MQCTISDCPKVLMCLVTSIQSILSDCTDMWVAADLCLLLYIAHNNKNLKSHY